MKKTILVLSLLTMALLIATPSWALLMTGQDIIAAPGSVIDDSPGAENYHQQAFDEAQDVLLTSNLSVDGGGIIASGTIVDSHMIFLNTASATTTSDLRVEWTFDGIILGVMSDSYGNLEAASNSFLGAPGTVYPGAFSARGMEGADSYSVTGNSIIVSMYVSEPGDWIRVVTEAPAPVPEPATILLLGTGLIGLAGFGKKKFLKK